MAAIVVACLLINLLVTGCGRKKQPDTAQSEAVPVEVVKAKKDALVETTVVTGKLEAVASSDVVPGGQPGKVEKVNVRVGQWVKKGQTLVVLENTVLEAAVRQAEQSVITAESALEQANIDYNKKKADYERSKTLFEQGAIPKAGQAGLETAEIAYKTAEQSLKQARAALEIARAGLVTARENYADAFVKAPISGVVTAVNVDPGELASTAVPVVSVADLGKVEVNATVAEDMVNILHEGDEVEVKVAAVSPEPFTGKVTSIAPAADRDSKAFPVEIRIDNPEGKLKPGMFAEINFTRKHPESIVVPKDAVLGSGTRSDVWVVEDGKAKRRQVEPGASNGEQVAIISGLKEGEQVVITGVKSLQEGVKVEIKKT